MPKSPTIWRVLLVLFCGVAPLLPAAPVLAAPAPEQTASAPEQATPAPTAARNANLRAGPGTSFAVVGGVTAGATLNIVAKNAAGDWYQLADGAWIFGQLVKNPPSAPPVSAAAAPAPAAQPAAAPAPAAAAPAAAPGWTLVAASASDFPGGRDHNHWYYLYSVGRNNFNWQEMRRPDQQGCFKDGADLGLELCSASATVTGRGDAAVQWKASKGGTYRFEWDAATLKFYQHTRLLGILEAGTTLPFAATVKGVIDWELFFWVATESGPYQIRIYRLDENAPAAAAASAAAPAASAAPAAVATFGAGMKRVGADVAAGTWRAPGSSSGCYWERLSGFSGTLASVIANKFAAGPQIVTVAASDKGFNSRGCGTWTLDLSPTRSDPAAPFGSGTWFVGKDVAPGVWQSAPSEHCYWETLSGFSGEFRDLYANGLVEGSAIVEIRAEETGFSSSGCGLWSKIE